MFINLTDPKYLLFGKINQNNNIIAPNNNKIIKLQLNNQQNIVNPITKYFLDKLFLDFRKGELTGKFIKEDTALYPIKIQSAGFSVYSRYETYVNILFDVFIKNYKINNEIDNLVSLNDFIIEFIKFCYSLERGPFTLSSYTISKYNSIKSTGLVVTLFEKSGIETDPNYLLYTNTVYNNGFLMDEKNKGTIILNLGHEAVIDKLKEEGINTITNFYSTYYTQTVDLDINLLSYILLKKYNEFCAANPRAKQRKPCYNNPSRYVQETKIRTPISFKNLYTKYNYLYWLKIYMFLRAIETYKVWSQNEFDFYVNELTNLYKASIDSQYQSGLNYVGQLIGRYPYPQSLDSNINFYYEPRL